MNKPQKEMVNNLIQSRIIYLKNNINECKAVGTSSTDPSDKEFLAESIKFWKAEVNELKKIKL
jgi:hypothetical protein